MRILPFIVSLIEKGDSRSFCRYLGSSFFFLMRGLITANLKVLGTYPNDNDKLLIAERGFSDFWKHLF